MAGTFDLTSTFLDSEANLPSFLFLISASLSMFFFDTQSFQHHRSEPYTCLGSLLLTLAIMFFSKLISFATLLSFVQAQQLDTRQSCSKNFNICSPPGAITGTLGPIDAGWGKLYQDIINVVNGYTIDDTPIATATVDPSGPARRQIGFCCMSEVIFISLCTNHTQARLRPIVF